MKTLKEPWFIGAVGGFLWVVICVVIIVIACRRRKRKHPYLGEQSNSKLSIVYLLSIPYGSRSDNEKTKN